MHLSSAKHFLPSTSSQNPAQSGWQAPTFHTQKKSNWGANPIILRLVHQPIGSGGSGESGGSASLLNLQVGNTWWIDSRVSSLTATMSKGCMAMVTATPDLRNHTKIAGKTEVITSCGQLELRNGSVSKNANGFPSLLFHRKYKFQFRMTEMVTPFPRSSHLARREWPGHRTKGSQQNELEFLLSSGNMQKLYIERENAGFKNGGFS